MLIAVYGTLRWGQGNHNRYLKGIEPLSQEMVNGYEMFNLNGSYPYITRGDGSILVELYDLTDYQYTVWLIDDMELDAGYERGSVSTSVGNAMIYEMPRERHEQLRQAGNRPPKILSGDWFEWLSKYAPERLRAI